MRVSLTTAATAMALSAANALSYQESVSANRRGRGQGGGGWRQPPPGYFGYRDQGPPPPEWGWPPQDMMGMHPPPPPGYESYERDAWYNNQNQNYYDSGPYYHDSASSRNSGYQQEEYRENDSDQSYYPNEFRDDRDQFLGRNGQPVKEVVAEKVGDQPREEEIMVDGKPVIDAEVLDISSIRASNESGETKDGSDDDGNEEDRKDSSLARHQQLYTNPYDPMNYGGDGIKRFEGGEPSYENSYDPESMIFQNPGSMQRANQPYDGDLGPYYYGNTYEPEPQMNDFQTNEYQAAERLSRNTMYDEYENNIEDNPEFPIQQPPPEQEKLPVQLQPLAQLQQRILQQQIQPQMEQQQSPQRPDRYRLTLRKAYTIAVEIFDF